MQGRHYIRFMGDMETVNEHSEPSITDHGNFAIYLDLCLGLSACSVNTVV